MTSDLSLVSVEDLLKELERRFDGFVFLARATTNERFEGEPIVTWYDAMHGDMFVTAGLAQMLVKSTDSALAASLHARDEALDDAEDGGPGDA